LEIGAVVDDWDNPQPLDQLPKFHTYVSSDTYVGQPFALGMHQKIFNRIAKKEQPYRYESPHAVIELLCKFLKDHFGDQKVTVAGKNFTNFDLKFLDKLCAPGSFQSRANLHHRVFDPSMLYYQIGDKELPSSKLCMERAGMAGVVAHTAVEDAQMVVELLRKHYKIGE
jgi:hypothetical protein